MAARWMIPSILVLANSFDSAGEDGSIEPLWYVSEEETGREDGRGDISKMWTLYRSSKVGTSA
jgi:hypothetical protein